MPQIVRRLDQLARLHPLAEHFHTYRVALEVNAIHVSCELV